MFALPLLCGVVAGCWPEGVLPAREELYLLTVNPMLIHEKARNTGYRMRQVRQLSIAVQMYLQSVPEASTTRPTLPPIP